MGRRNTSIRLRLEALEDRCTPAVAFVLSNNSLIGFDTAAVSRASAPLGVSGVNGGESLVGIDFRPQNGYLYGLGVDPISDTATLYAISTRTGEAAAVGGPGGISFVQADGVTPVDLPFPSTTDYDIDFNPAVDRLRVVAGGLNFRVNPNFGTPLDGDSTPANGFQTDGPINGATTTVGGTAYTNNQPNGNVTTQYTLDAATDSLFLQNPPSDGTQTRRLPIRLPNGRRLNFLEVNGFDIAAGVNATASNAPVRAGSGIAILTIGFTNVVYAVNLTTGRSPVLGSFGTRPIQSLAVQSNPGGLPAVSLSADGTRLLRFNTARPATVTETPLTGIQLSERLVGLDYRPQTGQLYALGVNATANTATLYLVDPQLGTATAIGTPGQIAFTVEGVTPVDLPDPASARYGLDFNPTTDELRVVTSTGLNFRVNPNDGSPLDGNAIFIGTNPDTPINGLPPGSTGVSGAAYTNSFGQPIAGGATTLYTLDAVSDSLFIQSPPNAGTQTQQQGLTLNGAALDITDVSGFDIPAGVRVSTSGAEASGRGYAVLTAGGTTGLYSIDLTSGALRLLGSVEAGATGVGLGDAPVGVIAFRASVYRVSERAGMARVKLTRTGGSIGEVTVQVGVQGGTPVTVTFADGQTVATALIPVTNNRSKRPNPPIRLTLSSPTNGALLGRLAVARLLVLNDD